MRWLSRVVTPGAVVYDVGANDGYIALIMARLVWPNGKVYAFEPDPFFRQKMQANFSLNPELAARISVLQYYVGNKYDLIHGFCVLDTLVFELGTVPAPDVVKIDVEGMEVQVLEGMKRIADKRFPHIFVECHLDPDIESAVQSFFAMHHVPTQRSIPSFLEVSRVGYNAWVFTVNHTVSDSRDILF